MNDWVNSKCLLLIECYKRHPLLWNVNNVNYYKKELKEEAWDQIGTKMNTTGANCKQKMISILASYRREKAREKKCTKVTKGKENTITRYKSRWFAFKALSFLETLKTSEWMKNNFTKEDDSRDDNTLITPTEPPNKKAKIDGKPPDPKSDMLKEASSILKTAADKPPPLPLNPQNPELRSFFDFIIEKMKTYSTQTKNSIQHGIFKIIIQADQGYYDLSGEFSQPVNNSDQICNYQERLSRSSIPTTSAPTLVSNTISPIPSAHDVSTEHYASSPASAYNEVDLDEKYSI